MREPGILKAALTSLRGTKAVNGLLEQYKFHLHCGGMSHAEAAHSRLSETIGPSARCGQSPPTLGAACLASQPEKGGGALR